MTDQGAHEGHAHHDHHAHGGHPGVAGTDPTALVRDPVCGMQVNSATTPHHATHDGTTYHFCSDRCRTKFEADPAAYVASAAPRVEKRQPEGVICTCPMHPQIRQIGPGNCPICGMALEPEVATQKSGPSA